MTILKIFNIANFYLLDVKDIVDFTFNLCLLIIICAKEVSENDIQVLF
jgi:hypothetical protein